MNSNSRINHGEAVYIIKTKFCISSIPQELYIIIAKAQYSLRLMIYTFGDEIHACLGKFLLIQKDIGIAKAMPMSLAGGYKKDIFGTFAYEFELLQKFKSSAKRILHYSLLLITSKNLLGRI